ncbi:hypothetical protein BVC80_7417g1 [Macleaya cordata]|uniref:Zinc finger protein n=1 Tax=Macleaya cordata TaxID=56857 RepID=A0A200R8V7_MACCD|nr:hypothetical protein BVC80_7417g1 [Macleaya cordata]
MVRSDDDDKIETSKILEESGTIQVPIQDPHISITKGRPKTDDKGKGNISSTGRFRSFIEVSSQKKRKCHLCNVSGHNKRTCPEKATKI